MSVYVYVFRPDMETITLQVVSARGMTQHPPLQTYNDFPYNKQ